MHPTPMPLRWTLRCGTPVTLRPVTPADGLALAALLATLSDRTRRWRFHGTDKLVGPGLVARLTQPGTARQQALLVLTDDGRVVAEARWSRVANDGVAAEFAIVVADQWQRRGIGQQLLHQLALDAQQAGVHWLLGEVMHDGSPVCRLMQGLRVEQREADPHEQGWRLLRFELQVSRLVPPPRRWYRRLMGVLRPRRQPVAA